MGTINLNHFHIAYICGVFKEALWDLVIFFHEFLNNILSSENKVKLHLANCNFKKSQILTYLMLLVIIV